VGRSLELGQLEGILDASVASERAHVVLVRGEAGIGKSCLIEKLAALAGARGYAAHKALIFDFGADAATDPIAFLTRSLLGVQLGATAEHQREAAAAAVSLHRLGFESTAHLEHLLALPGAPSHRAEGAPREEQGEAGSRVRAQQEVLASLLRAQSRIQPLLLLIEDVHWADPALLEQLARLVAALRGSRVVIVMTARTEADPIGQAWRAACAGCPLTTIDLGPLSDEEALQLAHAYHAADEQFVHSCVRRAEGNPLFLDQLLRTSRLERGGLPGSVQSLVLARLDRLAVQDRHALQAAAVLGQRFALPGVRELTGNPQAELQTLLEQGLIRSDGQDYFFAHALIQEAVYASVLRSTRQELHTRAARFFAERDPALHAEHLDAAQDRTAAAAYLRAAQHEAQAYHFQRALHLTERGLALCGDAELGHRLACLRGDLLRELGQADSSVEVFGAALDSAADDRQRFTALYGLASSLRILDRYAAALQAVDRAEQLGPQVADDAQLAELYFLRGNLYFPIGEIDACLAAHEQARAHALRAGSPLLEARALGSLGDAYYLRGEIQTAHEYFARCVALCRRHGLQRVEAACLPMLAITQLYRNEVRAGLENAHAGIALARDVGSFRAELLACDVLCSLLRYAAQWQPMKDAGERTLELARRLKARRFEADALAMIALAADALGERDRAEMLLDQSYGVSLEVGRKYTAAWTLGALAQVTSDERKRTRALREGEKLLAQGCVSHNYLHFYEAGMEAMLAARNWSEVERYAAALEAYTREQPVAWADFFARRGRLLAGLGRSPRNAGGRRELQALADYARGCGHVAALAGIDAALEIREP
jgi:tetratricopeptide (TPR) repeat protein